MGTRGSVRSVLVACIAAALVGAACGGGQSQRRGTGPEPTGTTSEVVLGLLTDLSGPFKSFGTDIQAAVNLAAEEINEQGQVMVRLVVRDTAGDPQQAVVGLRDLVTEKDVLAVLGPVSSTEAEVAFAQAGRLGVPIITGTANKEGITELGDGWAFRDTATNTQLYSAAMPEYKEEYDIERVALVFDEKQAFAAAAAQFSIPGVADRVGIVISQQLTVQTGQTDFTSVVQRVKGMGDIDGLFVVTAPIEGGLLAKELARAGVDLPVLGHPAQNTGAFGETAGDAVRDWVVPSVVDPSAENPRAKSFAEAMAARDEQPPTVPEAANYYDAVYMVAEVARRAGVARGDVAAARRSIREGLVRLEGFEGVVGPIQFLQNGDVDRRVYTVVLSGEGTRVLA